MRARRQVNRVSWGLFILGILLIGWAWIHLQAQTAPAVYIGNNTQSAKQVMQQKVLKSTNNVIPVGASHPANTPEHDDILYPIRPTEGDTIGSLTIPALKQTIPIIHGTDEDELEKGIGHFSQSVLPGENNNSVLSGHRDTVFARLGELKIGNELIVDTAAGTFTYRISDIRIVHKDDRTIIVPTDHAVLTVSTCYPFRFIGSAPDRYILTADLI